MRIHGRIKRGRRVGAARGDKIRFVPVAAKAARRVQEYLEVAGHGDDWSDPLFHPVKNHSTGTLDKPLNPASVYPKVVRRYGKLVGINQDGHGFCVHSLRATTATPWSTTPIWPKSRRDWDMPMSPPRACTTRARIGRKTVRPFAWKTNPA